MSDIFLQEDIQKVLVNKFVVVIGDSIQRAIYKDLVLLLQKNKYLTDTQLRAKGELSFENDDLVEGGRLGKMTNGIGYHEVRQFKTDYHLLRFYFVTRCYNKYVESILRDLQLDPKPDVIIMNSCLWDISRYGSNSIAAYKQNLEKLFTRFSKVLSDQCMVIWNTTLPISKNAKGGFLVPEIEFLSDSLRLDILEGNYFARQLVVKHGYDVLDLHYYLRHQLTCRANDGVHWDMTAHRRVSNLVLTHISEAWNIELPGRVKKKSIVLDENGNNCSVNKNMLTTALSNLENEDSVEEVQIHSIEKVHVDPPTPQDSFESEARFSSYEAGIDQSFESFNDVNNQEFQEQVQAPKVHHVNNQEFREQRPALDVPGYNTPVNNYGYNHNSSVINPPNYGQTFVAPSAQNNYALPTILPNIVQGFQTMFQRALNGAFMWQPYNNNVYQGRYAAPHQQGRFGPYSAGNSRGRRVVNYVSPSAMMGW